MNPQFVEWRFKFSKNQLKATRKEGDIKKFIFFDANYFLGKASFQPYLRLRNEKLMSIRAKVNSRYDNSHFLTINKHLTEVADILNRKELNFTDKIDQEGDGGSYVSKDTIHKFRNNFVRFMEDAGLIFFEMFHTHEDFDQWFNRGLFDGKYEGARINQDTVPMYSYISAFITGNECVEDIYNYWMNYNDLYPEAKEEIRSVREYLQNDYEA